MNGIIGMTELALNGATPEQREYLGSVRTSAETLLSILNDILDFSKIESRKLELERVPFAVRDLVADLLKPHALHARQKGLDLLCDIDPEVPARIVGDPVRLQQVIANLVGNAIKFTDTGHVLVQVREEARRGGATMLHFIVNDTGIGIPADKHATIFEAFNQADGSTTRRFGGTGLGLTISATLVHLMGGRIWVASQPNLGSTFHFTAAFDITVSEDRSVRIPEPPPVVAGSPPTVATITPARARHDDSPAPVDKAVTASNILLAEDNLVNQKVAVGLLTKRGHRVTVVQNGIEALAALEREPFDLVLMDVQMPEMGGLEATRAIREREEDTGRHTRIVAMTAHAMTGDRERCLTAGMDGYLSKPIDSKMLFAVVEQPPDCAVAPPDVVPFDRDSMMRRFGGDEHLVNEVIHLFLEDCPKRLAAIKSAVAARDADLIRTTAHALKGAAGNLSEGSLFEAAHVLERLGAEGRLDAAEAAWRRLSLEASATIDALQRLDVTA